jgi:hypothetical protein
MPKIIKDKTAAVLGALYESKNEGAIEEGIISPLRNGADSIVLSDVTSGDARLAAIYAALIGANVIYLREASKSDNFDFLEQYFDDLGINYLKLGVENSQEVFNEFKLNSLKILKGTKLTGKISGILSDRLEKSKNEIKELIKKRNTEAPIVTNLVLHPYQIKRNEFKLFASEKLNFRDADGRFCDLIISSDPVVVIWTKNKLSGSFNGGHPEHLLGNSGLTQLCMLARDAKLKIAIAGDVARVDKRIFDFDLRHVDGGAMTGLSLVQQYGALRFIDQHKPILNLAMRSGQVEPLPVLGIRTIYLEDVFNNQGARMQKLQAAVPDNYSRHLFSFAPTLKGQIKQLKNYAFDRKFQAEINKNQALKAKMQANMVIFCKAAIPKLGQGFTYSNYEANPDLRQRIRYILDEVSRDETRLAAIKTDYKTLGATRGFSSDDRVAFTQLFNEERALLEVREKKGKYLERRLAYLKRLYSEDFSEQK